MTDEELNHPLVKEGYIRVYEDHTTRWYTDIPESELIPIENAMEGQLPKIFWDEVRKEVDLQILEEIRASAKKESI